MYVFSHREFKNNKVRVRTPEHVESLVEAISEKIKEHPEIADQSVALLSTLLMESDWLRSPSMIYLEDGMQDVLETLGKDVGLVDLSPLVPDMCVIGDYLYRIDPMNEERIMFAYKPSKTSGVAFSYISVNDKDFMENKFCRILMGLSTYVSNFPELLREGVPNKSFIPMVKKQKSLNLKLRREGYDISKSFVRRPHLRALADKRFKRNSDGSVKVILVRQAEIRISKDQESKTLEAL
jgi:hypothetical protein